MDGMKPGTITMNGASLELSYSGIIPVEHRDSVLEISNLLTPRNVRRENRATELMREVCAQADEHGKMLLLIPESFDEEGMNTEQLAQWYTSKFDFTYLQHFPKAILIRMPLRAAQLWAVTNA